MENALIPKEVSWLSFNECVLEEAADPAVPLIQRLRFLGIFSSNLDEFFRVRVATLRQLARLKKRGRDILGYDPREVLETIEAVVVTHNRRFDEIYRSITDELNRLGCPIVDEKSCSSAQGLLVKAWFRAHVMRRLNPILIHRHRELPVLNDQSIYFFVIMGGKNSAAKKRLALIELPTPLVGRFFVMGPSSGSGRSVMLLDDVIRYCLPDIFPMFSYSEYAAYTIKLTRDAELDVELDFSESMIKKISRSLRKRKVGTPVRFVYDVSLPSEYLEFLISKLRLKEHQSIIPGGRYHNFRDFTAFPNLVGPSVEYPPLIPIPVARLVGRRTMLPIIRKRDLLLHYPYQPFDHFLDFLREAAIDPKVRAVKLTIYRAARHSSVLNALINAARNGKAVTVILELQARFDEEANIRWANALKEEGVFVNYGVPGLKVHAKLCLVSRKENGGVVHYAAVATGNFNEDTARLYTDHCLLTADPRITGEVRKLFEFLESTYKLKRFEHLLVSPFGLRERMTSLIEAERDRAAAGRPAAIDVKLNNLTDERIICKLIEAAEAGALVRLMVRGMCALDPDRVAADGRLSVIRVVDRFLEHTRIFRFKNEGNVLYFISTADMMPRNLDQRIEVVCPVYDKTAREELGAALDLSLRDTVKARLVGSRQGYRRVAGSPPFRNQTAMEALVREWNKTNMAGSRRRRTRRPPEASDADGAEGGTHAHRHSHGGR